MNVYATDFDGTLTNRPLDETLLSAIERWRQAGNLFGIVSGRPYLSIKSVLEQYHIRYDFLIANNGAVITDGDGNTICNTPMEPHVICTLLGQFKIYNHLYLRIDDPVTYKEYHGIPAYAVTEDGKGVVIGEDVWHTVTEVAVNYPTYEDTKQEAAQALEAVDNQANALISSPIGVDWVAGNVTKAEGLKKMIACLGIHPARIITTGDGLNDLAMLIDPDFEGYAVENAMPDLKKAVGRVIACPMDILVQI